MIPTEPDPATAEFKRTLSRFATGVAVLSADVHGQLHGMTVQTLTSLSLDPLYLSFSVARSSSTWEAMQSVEGLAISILSADQSETGLRFASASRDRFCGFNYHRTPTYGHPVLTGSAAWLEVRVVSELPGGDHIIVVAEPVHLAFVEEVDPLLYVAGEFGAFVPH